MKKAALIVIALAGTAHADPVTYDKGFLLKDGASDMKVMLRIETLWDLKYPDAQFSVERARLQLEGHAFTPKLGYKFQADFGKGTVTLKDFWFEAEVAPKVWLRSGQWKRPYSRQQMTSSGKLEMTSRAITDKAFRAGRDVGVAIHNGYESSPDGLEWVLGVFNGNGIAPKSVTDPPAGWMPAFVGRIGWNQGGIKGYSEADLEGGPLRYAVGLSLYGETDFDRDSKRTHQAEVDGIVKLDGLAASAAAYAMRSDIRTIGAHVQVGHVFGAGTERVEPVARYAVVKAEATPAAQEVLVGIGWLPYGHNCKILFDVGTHFEDDVIVQVGFDAGLF